MPDPVLILTGPPGAGKTTTAPTRRRRRASSSSRVRLVLSLHPCRVRRALEADSDEQNTIVTRIVADAAAGHADAGYFTIIDGIISPRWFFEPLRDALQASGHDVAYAVLRAPLAVWVSRAASRDASRLIDPAVIEQLWRDFADLGALERHAIDSDAK